MDLFGAVRIGYLLVESERLDDWHRFAREGLGLHAERADTDTLVLRVDAHARRIVVHRGPAEDVAAIGLELDSEDALREVRRRLGTRGLTPQAGRPEEAALRGVASFWRVLGPKRLPLELYTSPQLSAAPLDMRCSGFLTGAAGLGHMALSTRAPEAMLDFWKAVFDARHSDDIDDRIDGVKMEFSFLRLNERHHSVATAATRGIRLDPMRCKIHHFNLQAARLEDVVQAYLRCRAMGLGIANAIGQHPNDRELSFYVQTPSGFEMELGWNPLVVDETTWTPGHHHGISRWGHRPENLTLGRRAARLGRALASLVRTEHTA